jgi:hypothetical protein
VIAELTSCRCVNSAHPDNNRMLSTLTVCSDKGTYLYQDLGYWYLNQMGKKVDSPDIVVVEKNILTIRGHRSCSIETLRRSTGLLRSGLTRPSSATASDSPMISCSS